MSYTPPAGDALDFALVTGYVAPTGSAVNFALAAQSFIALGFTNTVLPVPSVEIKVAGFCSTQFGMPLCVSSQNVGATGFSSTTFGEHFVVGLATGFAPASFGTPEGRSHFNATTLGRVTRWNYPYTAYVAHNLVCYPWSFQASKIGFPQKVSLPLRPPHTYVGAKSFKAATFGTAAADTRVTTQALGAVTTAFGTPASGQAFAAEGLSTPAQFGQAASSFATRAAGFKVASFAAPSNRRTQFAASTYRATRWGVPTIERSNTFKTYGINCSGRFGQPKGYQRFNYPATGFHLTQLGAHASFETHHATMTPPTVAFGKPLLKRNVLC